ncbi:MAG: DMT family transporter [Alphaproteobacteria bacterium]|nr:DMT family transporter [Alphaproteobacteria bacterium]
MKETKIPHQDRITRGIVFGMAAYFMFGLMQAGAKILSETHNVIEIAFYRNLIALVPLLLYIALRNQWNMLATKKPGILAFRAIFGSISLIITFLTFHYLPMAEATVILFTAIILTPAIAFFLLGEYIGVRRWSAIIIGLLGVIIILRPSEHVPLIGICIGFGTAFMHAVINVTLRYLKTESPFTVTFYFILGGVGVAGLAMPFVARTPGPEEWVLFLAVGITGGLGQYFLTSAFRAAPASLVAMLNYTGLVWASLFDILLWNYIPGWNVFAGSAVIIVSQAYIIHREHIAEKKIKSSGTRNGT